tara:strand:+ start:597 stop:1955 length:1359 start_codon:yes stop_codon:yes gene_type:complete
MVTKVKSGVIGDNSVGITQLNVSDGSNGQALVTNGSGTLSFASVGVSGISSSADATAITIDSSEKVGINETSPYRILHVKKSDAAGTVAKFENSAGTVYIELNTNNQAGGDAAYLAYDSNKNLSFWTDDTQRLTIDASGNVGIGINSSITAPLYVAGNAVVTGSIISTGDTNIIYDSDDRCIFSRANGSETMHLLANGNVGINWGSSTARLGIIQNGSSTPGMNITDGSSSDFMVYAGYVSGTARIGPSTGNLAIQTGGTERARINTNGSLMVGTTTNPSYPHKIYAVGSAIPDGIAHFRDTDTTVALSNAIMSLQFSGDNDATNGYFIYMTDGNGAIGAIQAASGTSVSYGTSSDERLKKNIVDASSQLDMLKSVKVREFDWKRNDHHELGLIAQEIKDIIPNVVQQGGDDETKNPWSVDYGKLTPYLLKALQEQQTIIDDLKSRIETLEG